MWDLCFGMPGTQMLSISSPFLVGFRIFTYLRTLCIMQDLRLCPKSCITRKNWVVKVIAKEIYGESGGEKGQIPKSHKQNIVSSRDVSQATFRWELLKTERFFLFLLHPRDYLNSWTHRYIHARPVVTSVMTYNRSIPEQQGTMSLRIRRSL